MPNGWKATCRLTDHRNCPYYQEYCLSCLLMLIRKGNMSRKVLKNTGHFLECSMRDEMMGTAYINDNGKPMISYSYLKKKSFHLNVATRNQKHGIEMYKWIKNMSYIEPQKLPVSPGKFRVANMVVNMAPFNFRRALNFFKHSTVS